jgi:hypothetical protein
MVRPAADTNLIRQIIEAESDQELDKLRSDQKNFFSMMVYDDDVVEYLQREFGLDETDAECLRKRCQKKELAAYKEIEGKAGKVVADRMFEVASKYSFCKSHAMSYGYLSWALAYHKVHHPVEFWCGVLNHACSMYPRWTYVRQAIGATGFRVQEHVFDRLEPWKIDWNHRCYYKTSVSYQQKLKDTVKLSEKDILDQIARYGYWSEPEFVPDCVYIDERRYRGLVCATRRYHPPGGSSIQFVSIMISNNEIRHVIVNDSSTRFVQLNRVFSHF